MVKVDPEELREAAETFSPVGMAGTGMSWPVLATSVNGDVTTASSGVTQIDTGQALQGCSPVLASAMTALRGRKSAWNSALNGAADSYDGTDLDAAQRLGGLGDFNKPPA